MKKAHYRVGDRLTTGAPQMMTMVLPQSAELYSWR
jgi:hypothetical protein